jgi:ATPase subunit of ABC transporter with duplicated ATPase domains
LTTLHATDVTVSFADHVVLDRVQLTVTPAMKLGVLGPNGVGKSTLLGVLSGRVVPESGTVACTPPGTVGELRQETERLEGEDVLAYLARRTGVHAANAELDAATRALALDPEAAQARYADALDAWLALGATDFEARAAEVLDDLSLSAQSRTNDMAALSGGQVARVSLAAILLSRFDVLLLDEPTNDLDFDGLERLERFVNSFAGPLVIVSHDRAFLDRTVTHVAEIDEHHHTISLYAGGWQVFLEERTIARRHAQEAFDRNQQSRSDLKMRARRERDWATQGVAKEKKNPIDNDKAARKFRQEQTESLASRARRTERAIERLETLEKPWQGWDLKFSIANSSRSGAVVARLDSAVVDRGNYRLGPVTLEIGWGEKVGIIGANGSGKSTLLAALLGQIELTEGAQWLGPGVVVGEIDQARDVFREPSSLLEVFQGISKLPLSEARSVLAKFGLSAGHVTRPSTTLSPGERTRAALALLQVAGVNTLVLDEPTNHLDLPAIEELERALGEFPGTTLLVTHDRRLLEAVPLSRILRIVDGRVAEEDLPTNS